ncbi:MAG: primosomal protein N' [Acidobacteria bacterium OLB17]|nr:MAG: primosomal protein N' [Acidobacteria bacterium OLB17]
MRAASRCRFDRRHTPVDKRTLGLRIEAVKRERDRHRLTRFQDRMLPRHEKQPPLFYDLLLSIDDRDIHFEDRDVVSSFISDLAFDEHRDGAEARGRFYCLVVVGGDDDVLVKLCEFRTSGFCSGVENLLRLILDRRLLREIKDRRTDGKHTYHDPDQENGIEFPFLFARTNISLITVILTQTRPICLCRCCKLYAVHSRDKNPVRLQTLTLAGNKTKAEAIRFIEAALPLPLQRTFAYTVPSDSNVRPELGQRVRVPFGKRRLIGFVVAVHNELPADLDIDPKKIRPAIEFLDDDSLITNEILRLTEWTADYYASFWGEMLKAALPAGLSSETVRPKRRKAVKLLDPASADAAKPLTKAQEAILDTISAAGGEMLWTDLLDGAGVGASPVNTLVRRRFLEVFVQDVFRNPLSVEKSPERHEIALTEHQANAVGQITDAIEAGEFKAFLLHGVTGSGKTEVYFRAISHTLAGGHSA